MTKRVLFYYFGLFSRHYLLGLPGVLCDSLVRYYCPSVLVKGFRVIDPVIETRGDFVEAIGKALEMIEESDPIRFSRVKREIRCIVNAPAYLGTSYGRPLRFVAINFPLFHDADEPRITVMLIASALVYEATFGHLLSRGILRSRENTDWFEKSCCHEAHCFLRRIGMTKTPWDPQQLVTLPKGSFLRHAINEIGKSWGC